MILGILGLDIFRKVWYARVNRGWILSTAHTYSMNNHKWLQQITKTYVQMLHEGEASDPIVPFPQDAPWLRIKRYQPTEAEKAEQKRKEEEESEAWIREQRRREDEDAPMREERTKRWLESINKTNKWSNWHPDRTRISGISPKVLDALANNIYTA